MLFVCVLDPVQSAQAAKLIELRDGTSVQAYEHGLMLAIVALRGSVPAQWVIDFRVTLGHYAGFSLDQRGQFEDIFKELSETHKQKPGSGNRSSAVADVVSLGDTWLSPAIRQGLIQPLRNAHTYRWYKQMPKRWRDLCHRDREGRVDPNGEVYAAPYRWGATLIAYRKDKLLAVGGHAICDWADLLQPKLKGKIAFLDSSRELVGAALKSLGCSYNTTATDVQSGRAGITEQQLKEQVTRLRGQALLFSSRDHVRAVTAGDAWAVVGWSADLVQLSERVNSVETISPLSGTALWSDLWVVPTQARGGHQDKGPSPILPAWLEFGMQPERAITLPGLKTGASPLLLPPAAAAAAAAAAGSSTRGPLLHHSSASRQQTQHLGGSSGAGKRLVGEWSVADSSKQTQDSLQQQPDQQPASGPQSISLPSVSAVTGLLTDLVKGGAESPTRELEESLRLTHSNAYLPRQDVLAASEFLLPLSADTLAMYKRLLAP
ncbi:MAG: hypothetical protein WDW38_001941 [Sanguina aurantia]